MKLGLFSLLTIIFVCAKLFEVITWSWWLVFLPSIIGFCIIGSIFVLAIIIAALE